MLFIDLRHSAHIFFSLLICILVLAGHSEVDAAFRFAGGAYSIGYQTHEETEDGNLIAEADKLSQRLSLAVVNRGNAFNMRNNPYSLLLAYNHQRYSTKIQDSTYSPSANDLRWDGSLLLRQAKSRGASLYVMSRKRETSLFTPSELGRRIGVDFSAAVKKLIYSEHGFSIIKGHEKTLKSFLSYHSSTRDYANKKEEKEFSHLSLQRGINWLHFDIREVRASPGQNTESRSVRLGNISYRASIKHVPSSPRLGAREWFRLTNWLEISTDMLYSTTKSGASDKSNRYGLSLFGRGYRSIWSMFLSPSYSATKTSTYTNRRLSLPVSAYYFPARKFELGSRTNYVKSDSTDYLGATVSESEYIYESLDAIITPQSWLRMRPSYSIARTDSNGLRSLSQNVALDLTAKGVNLDASLDSSYGTSSSESISGNDSKVDKFRIKADVRYSLRAWVRSMSFSHTYATVSDNSGDRTESNLSQFDLRAVPSYRLNADLRVLHSEKDVNGQTSYITEVDTSFNYDTRKRFSNEMDIYMKKTDDSKRTRLEDRATYRFAKNLESKTKIQTVNDSSGSGDAKQLHFTQSIFYSHGAAGFLRRRLYDLSGRYSYSKFNSYGVGDKETSGYSVAINYYPSRVFALGGSYSYSSNNVSDITTETRIYANLRYPKLQVGISYSSEVDEIGGAGEKVVEKIDFSLTKRF